MTIISRLGVALLFIAAALPFVVADCNNDEFWWKEKSCCLPYGGPSWQPEPPPEKKCPHSEWSWSDEHDCCTPYYPAPPPPQCEKDWYWSSSDLCCTRQQPPPQSSIYWKRAQAKRAADASRYAQFCPMGLTACPVAGASGLSSDFECLDTANELESCGGCASIGKGQDCTAITGAWNVGCELGSCAVYTCAPGFKRSRNGKFCTRI